MSGIIRTSVISGATVINSSPMNKPYFFRESSVVNQQAENLKYLIFAGLGADAYHIRRLNNGTYLPVRHEYFFSDLANDYIVDIDDAYTYSRVKRYGSDVYFIGYNSEFNNYDDVYFKKIQGDAKVKTFHHSKVSQDFGGERIEFVCEDAGLLLISGNNSLKIIKLHISTSDTVTHSTLGDFTLDNINAINAVLADPLGEVIVIHGSGSNGDAINTISLENNIYTFRGSSFYSNITSNPLVSIGLFGKAIAMDYANSLYLQYKLSSDEESDRFGIVMYSMDSDKNYVESMIMDTGAGASGAQYLFVSPDGKTIAFDDPSAPDGDLFSIHKVGLRGVYKVTSTNQLNLNISQVNNQNIGGEPYINSLNRKNNVLFVGDEVYVSQAAAPFIIRIKIKNDVATVVEYIDMRFFHLGTTSSGKLFAI